MDGRRLLAGAGALLALTVTAGCGDAGAAAPRGAPEGAVELEVLSVRTWQSSGLAVTDLATGRTRYLDQGERGMTGDPVDGAVLTVDGTVVFWQDGVVTAVRPDDPEPLLVHRPDRRATPDYSAPSLTVHPTPDGRHLWVAQPGLGCCGEAYDAYVELVETATGRVVAASSLPPEAWAAAATEDGLVLGTVRYVETADGWVDEPGSAQVLLLPAAGDPRALGSGRALAAGTGWVLVRACTPGAPPERACDLQVVDTATGHRRPVPHPAEGAWTLVTERNLPTVSPAWSATTAVGRTLLALVVADLDDPNHTPLTATVVAIDVENEEAEVLHRVEGGLPPAAWDRTGRRIVLFGDAKDHRDRDVTVVDPETGTTTTLPDAVPDGYTVLYVR